MPAGELTKTNIEIHGIMPEELENQEDIELVLSEFLEFIRDSVLVGHFVHIDLKFLNRITKQLYGKGLINPAIDTHNLHEWLCENGMEFKRHYHGVSNKTNLFAIAQRYGITIESTHNALNDALMTALLFQRFIYFLRAEGINTLGELLDVGRV
jgi:DNA polymerase-3 subunit epsilon